MRYFPRFLNNFNHQISRSLKISPRCIRQIFSQFHTVATKPGVGRPTKGTDHEKSLIKLQQIRDASVLASEMNHTDAKRRLRCAF